MVCLSLGVNGGGNLQQRQVYVRRLPGVFRGLLGQVGRVYALAVLLGGRQVLQQVHVHLWTDMLAL